MDSDTTHPDTGQLAPLHVDGRRLRLSWLGIHQRPVAHTEQALANEYLARNRGILADYLKVVADVLDQQVAHALAVAPIPVLSEKDLQQARTDLGAVAARHGLDDATLGELIAGRLDTALAGCTDNLHSPHAPAGQPCGASFCSACKGKPHDRPQRRTRRHPRRHATTPRRPAEQLRRSPHGRAVRRRSRCKRWVLTHKHPDLRREFEENGKKANRIPEEFQHIQARVVDLEAENKRLRTEKSELSKRVDIYAQVIHELTTDSNDSERIRRRTTS